jgi:peptidoglycan glycosyltransferase
MAALRKSGLASVPHFECKRLPDGRVGNYVKGFRRPIRDDIRDVTAHGDVDLEEGLVVSCNAYFAQLGQSYVGAEAFSRTARDLGIQQVVRRDTKLSDSLPQAAYGQGEVLATPLQMARVAGVVAQGGRLVRGEQAVEIVSPAQAAVIARAMRKAVTSGTGRAAARGATAIAGKTGTAEIENAKSHAWFAGYAPAAGSSKQIAFAIIIENGGYGGGVPASLAPEIVALAKQAGWVEEQQR